MSTLASYLDATLGFVRLASGEEVNANYMYLLAIRTRPHNIDDLLSYGIYLEGTSGFASDPQERQNRLLSSVQYFGQVIDKGDPKEAERGAFHLRFVLARHPELAFHVRADLGGVNPVVAPLD